MTDQPALEKCLFAFYDFQVSPVSFDFSTFLVLSRLRAEQEGCERLHVVFVPGPCDGFRDDDVTYDSVEKHQRLRRILLPMTAMLDIPVTVSLCQRREEARQILESSAGPIFPDGYTLNQPTASFLISSIVAAHIAGQTIPSLRPTDFALRNARSWLDTQCSGKHPIVITLREAAHSPVRNSNIKAWTTFARGLDPNRFVPIIVRDTARAADPPSTEFEGIVCCPMASFDLHFRHALYQLAYLNLTIPNGPTSLCWMNSQIKFLLLKLQIDEAAATNSIFHLSMGLEVGGQYPPATPFQHLVWESDDLDIIQREFDAMVERIEDSADAENIAPDPEKTEDPMAVAVRLQATGRLEDATTIYQDIVTREPDNADAWHLLGIIAHQAERPDAAEKMILRAISLKPEQANYYINLSAVLRKTGRNDEAANCLWRAIGLSPADAGAHADLAELLQIQGVNDKARSALLKAIQLSPASPSLCERAARVLHELGHSDEAASLYRRAIDLREEARIAHARRLPEVPSVSLSRG